ncbi:MAG: beta-galactosidase [Verrucomicrobia bacterium]|nr:beta-galactosidase [Verrucomicrobiota bacterium]
MEFKVEKGSFCLNGKEVFLNAGEIQYYRIKTELWDTHLSAAKEAGLMAVATYIPWDWHEPEQGKFDFTGETHPQRNLVGWMEKCQAHGLYCIVKPGPFILAEYRGAGVPQWFLDTHSDDCFCRTREGVSVPGDAVSFMHPTYLAAATKWYDQVMPLIADRHISKGGPIIMMQVCNEVGVFSWLAHRADYNTPTHALFLRYLAGRYDSIDELNRLWKTNYASFDDVELPPDQDEPYADLSDRARDRDWTLFWRWYFGEYLRLLIGMARERGVDMPFYHNLPGWIYGSGFEFPVNITMYEDLYDGLDADLIFGVDHIPEYLSHRNMHDDRIINDMTLAMQQRGPLFAAEFQSGSREFHVATNPREMELFYKASLANGLRGWNYYMFSQGKNMPEKGYSGDTFYWYTPLSDEGKTSSAYPLVQKTSKLIKTLEPIVVKAERRADVCVLFSPAHYATELERPVGENAALQFDAVGLRKPAYFDGLLRALQVMNVDYDMLDLSKCTSDQLATYKQVWSFTDDRMDGADQQKLVDYTDAGGALTIFPTLPSYDLMLQPCTVLRDWLGIETMEAHFVVSPLFQLFDQKDVKCANPQMVFAEGEIADATVVGKTLSGKPCAIEKTRGSGKVLIMGTWLGYDTEGHITSYANLLEWSKATLRQTTASHACIAVRERFTEDGQAMVFAGNYFNEPFMGSVTYTHPATGLSVEIPYNGEDIEWPGLYAMLTPVNQELAKGVTLLHTTSDLLGCEPLDNGLLLRVVGDRDLVGELALEGAVQAIELDGAPLALNHDGDRVWVRYEHRRDTEHQLHIVL